MTRNDFRGGMPVSAAPETLRRDGIDLVRLSRPQPCRRRLVCFPYAGAGAGVYRRWAPVAAEDVDVLAVQLPGRENRWQSPLMTDLKRVAEEVAERLRSMPSLPTVLFGHSMGALMAFEVARLDAVTDLRCLAVSARVAPHLTGRETPVSRLSDPEFIEHLSAVGGTPREILAQRELMELLLPMLRADFRMVDDYRPAPWPPRLKCPVLALYGREDVATPVDGMRAWADVTDGAFELHAFEGGHFFLEPEGPRVIDALAMGRSGVPA